MCRGVPCESRKFPPVPVSPTLSVSFLILWGFVFGTVPRSVFILCVLRLPINWGNYIYWRVILCGSLLVGMVFVLAKFNVEVCLVVFLVCLVAQCAVRSAVNVSVKEGNFPVL